MDNVLPAVLVAAIMLMGSLALGRSGFSSFRVLSEAWQDAEERSVELARSDIVITSINRSGANVDAIVQNDGATPVVDFSRMDVVVQYTSGGNSYIKYIPFTTQTTPQPQDTWRVLSITNDVIDPSVLNTGESMTIRVRLNPAPGTGSHWLQVTTELGISASMFFN